MDQDELAALKKWFTGYYHSFFTPRREDQRNHIIKYEHTLEVCRNALRIARDLGLDERGLLLAEAIALFHDVGRFPQYQRYRTFDDSVSVNHAALSAKVLVENNVLGRLDRRDRDLIVRAVTLHNVFSLPGGLDDETLLFARIIRDADKLDILRVVIEYFTQEEGSRAEAVALGLPDRPSYSNDVLACLKRGEMARKDMLTTRNDFKLLQLAWLYDLNFVSSLRMVRERDYIRLIGGLLPQDDDISGAIELVKGYVEQRVRGE
ncbi:MAG TPA: HD domain-containing protein [Nitrospirota bacterium]